MSQSETTSGQSGVVLRRTPAPLKMSKTAGDSRSTSAILPSDALEKTKLDYARRPTRGLEIAKSPTPAVLSIAYDDVVTGENGTEAKLQYRNSVFNSSTPEGEDGGLTFFSANFLLQAVSFARNEKFQEIETFGATYGFFYGERPTTLTAQAILPNSEDFPWVREWVENYSEAFRGTKLVESKTRVYLEYSDFEIEGYMLNCQLAETADNPHVVSLTFSLWVTNILYAEIRAKQDAEPLTGYDPYVELDDTTYKNQLDNIAYLQKVALNSNVRLREANLKWLAENRNKFGQDSIVGLGSALGFLKGQAAPYIGKLGALVDTLKAALLGTQIVVPAGFVGSEVYSGFAEFDYATDLIVDGQLLSKAGINPRYVRLPPEFSVKNPQADKQRGLAYYKVSEEYPFTKNAGSGLDIRDRQSAVASYFQVGRSNAEARNAALALTMGATNPLLIDDGELSKDELLTEVTSRSNEALIQGFSTNNLGIGLPFKFKVNPAQSNLEGARLNQWAVALASAAYGGAKVGAAYASPLRQTSRPAPSANLTAVAAVTTASGTART